MCRAPGQRPMRPVRQPLPRNPPRATGPGGSARSAAGLELAGHAWSFPSLVAVAVAVEVAESLHCIRSMERDPQTTSSAVRIGGRIAGWARASGCCSSCSPPDVSRVPAAVTPGWNQMTFENLEFPQLRGLNAAVAVENPPIAPRAIPSNDPMRMAVGCFRVRARARPWARKLDADQGRAFAEHKREVLATRCIRARDGLEGNLELL